MPVLDHETHPSTQRGEDHRYGCWNKPRSTAKVSVKDGWQKLFGVPLWGQKRKLIDDFGSRECRYDMSEKDHRCHGCKQRGDGEKYVQEITKKVRVSE